MPEASLITSANVHDYFREQLLAASTRQRVDIDDATVVYLVNLLAEFTHARNLFNQTDDGLDLKPLAMQYADAVEAERPENRNAALKQLGDVALFISGLFAGSLNRKAVDVDYYIAMGGSAYSCLADVFGSALFGRARGELFGELAAKFSRLVDVLGEISDASALSSNADVLRIYEVWLKTGSPRALEKLRRLGVQPLRTSASLNLH